MSCDAHNRLIARLSLRQLCNSVMPQVVKAQTVQRTLYVVDVSLALFAGTQVGRLL